MIEYTACESLYKHKHKPRQKLLASKQIHYMPNAWDEINKVAQLYTKCQRSIKGFKDMDFNYNLIMQKLSWSTLTYNNVRTVVVAVLPVFQSTVCLFFAS